MKCIEKDCRKEAVKTYVGKDGVSVSLCNEHYEMWATTKGLPTRSKRMWLGWFTVYLVGKFSALLLILRNSSQIDPYFSIIVILLQAVELLTFPLMLKKYYQLQVEKPKPIL